MSDTGENAPIPLPLRCEGKAPYFAWLERRFPDGAIGYNPPLAEFFATPSMQNAWTSYVPEGSAPTELRMDIYLRRGWNGDVGVLCVGNAGPAGDLAPTSWTAPTLALLDKALAEIEAGARSAGFTRIAVVGADPDMSMGCRDRGYTPCADGLPWTDELVRQVA